MASNTNSMRFIAGVCFFMLLLATSYAAAPLLINYQGRLTNNSGAPLAGTYSVTFTIYDAAVGGNSKWTETQSVTTDADGLFAVLLGSITPSLDTVFKDTIRYLQIQVGVDPEITPRTRVVSSPFAFRVASVDSASGGNIKGSLSIGSGHTIVGLNTFVAGNNHSINGNYSVIGGGQNDTATSLCSTIGGGQNNAAVFQHSTVAGGYSNRAEAIYSAVGGGQYNIASGSSSVVPGGNRDTASGVSAVAIGGYRNNASGDFSFAAGYRAKAEYTGSFVWADYTASDQIDGAPNRFVVRATNGAFFTSGRVNVGDAAGNTTTISKGDYRQDNSIVAWGKVTGSTGFVSTNEYGVSNVVRNSAGNYTVTLDITADAAANIIPMAAAEVEAVPVSAATARIVSINQQTTTTFDVYIVNGSWLAVDNDFVFMVTAR